ncbi:hypothetical protein Aduo_016434 [Ancylostoma duodenale]
MFSLSADVLFLCNDTGTLIRILCQNESFTLSSEERVLIVKTETDFVEQDTASAPNPTPSAAAMRPSTSYSNAFFFPAAHPYPAISNTFPASGNSFPGTANPFTPILPSCLFREDRYRHQRRPSFRCYKKDFCEGKQCSRHNNPLLVLQNGAQLTDDNEFCPADILTRVIGRKPQVYIAALPENEDDYDDNSFENAYEATLSDVPNGTHIDAETQTCNVLLEGLIENIFKCPLCTIAHCTKMYLVCGHAVCTECFERISPVQDEDEEEENPLEEKSCPCCRASPFEVVPVNIPRLDV